ncbi:magnesium transporter [Vibrio sp. S4M6]|uniref:magnesium transporter n=1 Tax=Vibrio sinus TaxID=2946865 RepID=UPI00202A71DE|nr:magnesium transporter [Vibrio sinus]MCL9782699.1 magnesium transporter [Vibrio sinus]
MKNINLLESKQLISVINNANTDNACFRDFKNKIKENDFRTLNKRFRGEGFKKSLSYVHLLSHREYLALIDINSFKYSDDVKKYMEARHPVLDRCTAKPMLIFHEELLVGEVVKQLHSHKPGLSYLVSVNKYGLYTGLVPIHRLFNSDLDLKLSEVTEFVQGCHLSLDQEEAVKQLHHSVSDVLPLLTGFGEPVGVLDSQSAIDIVMDEQTEDMERIMGIQQESHESNYMDTSVFTHIKKRVFWIVGLVALGLLSGMVIHSYDDAIAAFTILALYMPMVADTGGNTGSQSATVVVRAMALGYVSVKDWLRVLWKETRIATVIGLIVATLSIGKVAFLSQGIALPGNLTLFALGGAIGLALFFQVLSATVIGALLPLISKKAGLDPAVVASPAITTIVDVTGLLIYFYSTTQLLGLA